MDRGLIKKRAKEIRLVMAMAQQSIDTANKSMNDAQQKINENNHQNPYILEENDPIVKETESAIQKAEQNVQNAQQKTNEANDAKSKQSAAKTAVGKLENENNALGFLQELGASISAFRPAITSSTNANDPNDAFSYENTRKAIAQLKTLNKIRKAEGLPELKVDPSVMMAAMYEANYIAKHSFDHVHADYGDADNYSKFVTSTQNLSGGPSNLDPFDDWYTYEKKTVLGQVPNKWGTGHYYNIIANDIAYTGYGISTYNNKYSRTDVNDFRSTRLGVYGSGKAYTVAEFESKFNDYVKAHFTGLIPVDNTYKFVRNGVYETFTGISKSITNNQWYFSRNGIIDWNFTGVAKSIENGQWYHCNKGALDWNFTGVSKSVENGKWYFSRKGKLDWSFTGVAKSIANGKWYHAKNGQVDWNFTGISRSVENGQWYFSRKGQLDWSFTGVAKSVADGKWYHVTKGKLNWNYTGLSKSVADSKYYYVTKGKLNWNYSGKVRFGNSYKTVRKGKLL